MNYYYHGVTNYLENKNNIQTNELNIFSNEAGEIIKKWELLK